MEHFPPLTFSWDPWIVWLCFWHILAHATCPTAQFSLKFLTSTALWSGAQKHPEDMLLYLLGISEHNPRVWLFSASAPPHSAHHDAAVLPTSSLLVVSATVGHTVCGLTASLEKWIKPIFEGRWEEGAIFLKLLMWNRNCCQHWHCWKSLVSSQAHMIPTNLLEVSSPLTGHHAEAGILVADIGREPSSIHK